MSQPSTEMPQGQPDFSQQQNQPDTGHQAGPSPYQPYLEKIPESMRPLVEPAFKEWDANVTRQYQTYSQQLAAYQPYQELFNQYEPEALEQAVNMARLLNDDPQQIFNALAEHLGYQVGDQGGLQEDPDLNPPQQFDLGTDPRFQRLEQSLGGLVELIQTQQQQQQQSAEEQQVLQEMQQLSAQYGGNFTREDETVILSLAAQSGDLAGAYAYVAQMKGQQQVQQNLQQAPVVGGAGGNTPSPVTDVAKWSEQQRKEAAIAAITASIAQKQGA